VPSSPQTDPIERLLLDLGERDGSLRLLTVTEVAQALQVEASWVYEHSTRLAAVPLGTGPRAPIRFEARLLAARLRSLGNNEPAKQPPAKPTRTRTRTAAGTRDLLPIRARIADERGA
jgi:hypothetical protein